MTYEWHVTFRNDRMGFQKKARVEAPTYGKAVAKAYDDLAKRGYRDETFEVIELKRCAAVSR